MQQNQVDIEMQLVDSSEFKEKVFKPLDGFCFLMLTIASFVLSVASLAFAIYSSIIVDNKYWGFYVLAGILFVTHLVLKSGIHELKPNNAICVSLCGKYVGTVRGEGLKFISPLYATWQMSLKRHNLEITKSKVNDLHGSPVMIQAIVVFKICDTAKASFEVQDYNKYTKIQCEAAQRACAALFPYESHAEGEMSLRGNPDEVGEELRKLVQDRVRAAGIEVVEARISELAYAKEIASAMLRKQQAGAIIAARERIVKGACGMVQMAVDELEQNNVVDLEKKEKSRLVSNLLIVLCGEEKAQAVINTEA